VEAPEGGALGAQKRPRQHNWLEVHEPKKLGPPFKEEKLKVALREKKKKKKRRPGGVNAFSGNCCNPGRTKTVGGGDDGGGGHGVWQRMEDKRTGGWGRAEELPKSVFSLRALERPCASGKNRKREGEKAATELHGASGGVAAPKGETGSRGTGQSGGGGGSRGERTGVRVTLRSIGGVGRTKGGKNVEDKAFRMVHSQTHGEIERGTPKTTL